LVPNGAFGRYKEAEIGVSGSSDISSTALFDKVRQFSSRFRTTAVATPFESSRVTSRWAIITGSGASSDTLAEAAATNVDTLIVGEGPHHSAVLARELGIVVMYAGHYATETLGVRALADLLAKTFDLPHSFVDLPTGL
jgi:putative NIF3 family GTP cyclohydrolase 1 type 2